MGDSRDKIPASGSARHHAENNRTREAFTATLVAFLATTTAALAAIAPVDFDTCYEAGRALTSLTYVRQLEQGEAYAVPTSRLCKAAMEANPEDYRAMYYYGRAYGITHADGGGYITKARKGGDIEALKYSLWALENKYGLNDKAKREIFKMWSQAAQSGDPEARIQVALRLIDGNGTEKDINRAWDILGNEAIQGNASAHYFIALKMDKLDRPSPLTLSRKSHLGTAAKLGLQPAQAMLGFIEATKAETAEQRLQGEQRMIHATRSGDFAAILVAAQYYLRNPDQEADPMTYMGPMGRDPEKAANLLCRAGQKGENVLREYLGNEFVCP